MKLKNIMAIEEEESRKLEEKAKQLRNEADSQVEI